MESDYLSHTRMSPFTAERLFLRLGLIAASALLFRLAFDSVLNAPLTRTPALVGVLVATTLFALLVLIAAGLPNPPTFSRWLILVAFATELLVRTVVSAQTLNAPDVVVTDSGLYTDLAGELIQRGQNPYAWDLGGAFDLYRTTMSSSTPTLSGANESRFPYPPLEFMLVVPFQAIGLPGVLSVSVLAHLAVLVLLFLASPRTVQPLVLIPVAAGFDFTFLSLISSMDILWVALLIGMILVWRKPSHRAILYGLAASIKQGPWLILPFLLIRIWRDEDRDSGLSAVGHFLLVAESIFLLVNGLFMVWDIKGWLLGIAEPLQDALVYYSQGSLSSLTQFGLAYLPKSYYLIATLVALALVIFIYWRHYPIVRDSLWILPGIFMWFSYRTLVTYWLYWALPLLAAIITRTRTPNTSEPYEGKSWLPTVVIGTSSLAAVALIAVFMVTVSPEVVVKPLFPILINSDGHFDRMTVQVTNRGDKALTPRFSLQGESAGANPFAWYIDSGPFALEPGRSGVYQISAQRPDGTFFVHDPVRIVVTDAGGDYALRGVATIGPDRSYLWPDAIPNPSFIYWDSTEHSPIFWGLDSTPTRSGAAALLQKDGVNALGLSLNASANQPSRVMLQSVVIFPMTPFVIRVHPDSEDPRVEYGLEVDDGVHRLRILFGSRDSIERLSDGTVVIRQSAALHQWSDQTVDLSSIYGQIGWTLPPLVHDIYRGLDTDLRLVLLRLVLSVNGRQGNWQAYFGPITQPDYSPDPRTLMAETLDNPGDYYVRLAEFYVRGRNYALALEAYRTALEYAPDSSRARDGLKSVEQRLTEEGNK